MTVTIDSVIYDVPIISLNRTADILDLSAERSEDGILHRTVIGTYYNYQLSFGFISDPAIYQQFWDVLTSPLAFHTVTLPSDETDFTFTAYISSVSDQMIKIKNGINYYRGLTAKFTAQSPARIP